MSGAEVLITVGFVALLIVGLAAGYWSGRPK